MGNNILYAQSGGVTSVINASACGVIETARQHNDKIGKVYAARNGIIGALTEELIDTSHESDTVISGLKYTPGGAFGSCRYKLKAIDTHRRQYERLIEIFAAHDIGYFFYNGGGDSQDTAYKVSQIGKTLGYPIACIGIPKTIDNDLALTDNCPGFGSVAKYVAVSIREAGLDVLSMCSSSTKVFIMEVMGRHTGWIAAAGGLAAEKEGDAPHIILFPEIPFDQKRFLAKVESCVKLFGFCAIIVSEGVKNQQGEFLSAAKHTDAFGHAQLGGVAPYLADLIKRELDYKHHWAVSDYLQRSARHIASETDLQQAYALGREAVNAAILGKQGMMLTIRRKEGQDYQWEIGEAPLSEVANKEKTLPREYISEDGLGITQQCRSYLQPLIIGEAYPPYHHGLPQYVQLKNISVDKKLGPFEL